MSALMLCPTGSGHGISADKEINCCNLRALVHALHRLCCLAEGTASSEVELSVWAVAVSMSDAGRLVILRQWTPLPSASMHHSG